MSTCARAILAIAVLMGLSSWARAGESASPAAPRLYVVAPDADATWKTNVLPAEAVLRAVATEAAAAGADVTFVPVDQRATLAADAWPRLTAKLLEGRKHTWAFAVERAEGRREPAGEAAFEWGTFEALVKSVSDATQAVTLGTTTAVGIPPAPKPTRLSEADSAKLAEALSLICNDGPGVALAQAAGIETVLAANPRSPEALCAAAWPACIMGTGDLYGMFQLRNRFLAIPLSWWVEARLCGAGETPREKLTAGWVALLCGFPKEGCDFVSGDDTRAEPLGAAIALFATRDWRMAGGDVLSLSAVEVMAWLWAVQQCGLFNANMDTFYEIARKGNSPWYFPVYDVYDVGAGHRLTPVMMALAGAEALDGVLKMEALPESDRDALRRDLQRLQTASKGRASYGDEAITLGMPTEYAIRLLEKAFGEALAAPDGPMKTGPGGHAWQVLSPWAWAQAERGIFYRSVFLRLDFLANMWGVPEQEIVFLKTLARAYSDGSPMKLCFTCGYQQVGREGDGSGKSYWEFLKTEIGREAAQYEAVATWYGNNYIARIRDWAKMASYPCGAWQGEKYAYHTDYRVTSRELQRTWYDYTVGSDPHSELRGSGGNFGVDAANLVTAAKSEPYNYFIKDCAAWRAGRAGDLDTAISFRKDLIELAPNHIDGYSSLADIYEDRDSTEEAIAVLRQGIERCPHSVYRSNVMARLSNLLVDQGKAEEALPIAREASESYSGMGLHAYGKALMATGHTEEGLEYYRKSADRYYGSSVSTYLEELVANSTPAEKVVAEALRYAQMERRLVGTSHVITPLMLGGHYDVVERLLRGPLAFEEPSRNSAWLGLLYMLEGDYKTGADALEAALDGGYPDICGELSSIEAATEAYIAALLARNETLRGKAFRWLAGIGNARGRPMQRYITGRASGDAALKEAVEDEWCTIDLYWIYGVEADAGGRRDEAMQWYRKCVEHPLVLRKWAGRFSTRRLKELESGAPCPPPATPPAQ